MAVIPFNRALNARTGESLGEQVRCAHTWWTRLVGLLGTRDLPISHGVWLRPCQGVHTLGMRYPIDVVFLDRKSRVSKIATRLRPYRFCLARRGVNSVLELPAGTLDSKDLRVGDSIVFEPVSSASG